MVKRKEVQSAEYRVKGKRIFNGLVFEPVSHDVAGDVDVDLAQASRAGIEKFVRDISRCDDDLSGVGDQRLVADGEDAFALLDDEDLFIRMAVQANLFPRLHIDPDERDIGIELRALEVEGAAIAWEIIAVEQRVVHKLFLDR